MDEYKDRYKNSHMSLHFFLLLLGNLCTSYGKKSMRLTDCICGEAGARFAGEAVCLMISLHLYIYP